MTDKTRLAHSNWSISALQAGQISRIDGDTLKAFEAGVAMSEARIRGLELALQFYANPDHWQSHTDPDPEGDGEIICPIGRDCGDYARNALAGAGHVR